MQTTLDATTHNDRECHPRKRLVALFSNQVALCINADWDLVFFKTLFLVQIPIADPGKTRDPDRSRETHEGRHDGL